MGRGQQKGNYRNEEFKDSFIFTSLLLKVFDVDWDGGRVDIVIGIRDGMKDNDVYLPG